MQDISLTVDTSGIALITLDVLGRPMNVLTPDLLTGLAEIVDRISADTEIRGAIITSGKASGFIAGADLKDFVGIYDRGTTATAAAASGFLISSVFRRMETCGKPIAAAINGLALGGGLELTLACHYRVLSDDPKAVVGLPEVTIGLLPGAGGTQRLPRLIGVVKALDLMLSGSFVKPAEALKIGLVHEIAAAQNVVNRARAWLLKNPQPVQPWDAKSFRLPGGSGALAPFASQTYMTGAAALRKQHGDKLPAPIAIMSCVAEGTITGFDTGLRIESKYFGSLLSGVVARNLMRTMFINKGLADKLDRRPKDMPKSKVEKLCVLGAGLMGAGIAYVAAQAGIDVVLLDSTQAAADHGKDYSVKLLAKLQQKGVVTTEQVVATLGRIVPTTDYAHLAGIDFVIEAVFENREIKREVTQKAEAVIAPSAVFASNTSTLPISGLAEASQRPGQFIGMHFFSPVDRMPLLEIILGSKTSQATLARALDLVGQLRKTPIIVNDSAGFFTSRVYATFVDEGACMLDEGIAPALIENAARLAGFPVGPLASLDETSQELTSRIIQQMQAEQLPEPRQRKPAAPIIEAMVRLGRKGRRFDGGFYEYPKDGGKKYLWPALSSHFPVSGEQPDAESVGRRLLTIQALEAARCLEENVITKPVDADLGSVLGLGYPRWTGGMLSYVDTVGIRRFVADCEAFADRHGPRYRPSQWLKQRAEANVSFYPKEI